MFKHLLSKISLFTALVVFAGAYFVVAAPRPQIIQGGSASGGSGTVTSIVVSSPLTGGTITTNGTIACPTASGSQAGCLASADWTTFNNKGAGTVTHTAGALDANAVVLGNAGADVFTVGRFTTTANVAHMTARENSSGLTSGGAPGFTIETAAGAPVLEFLSNVANGGVYWNDTTSAFDGALFFTPTTHLMSFYTNATLNGALSSTGDFAIKHFIGAGALDTATAVGLCVGSETIGGISTSTLASCISLRQYKMNIMPLLALHRPSMLDEVMNLTPVSYSPKHPNGFTTGHELGLIAEDVQKVDDRLSTFDPRTKSLQGVQYDRMGVVAIAAIQELKHIVDAQQRQIDALKVQIRNAR